jgi:hypothetical protein
MRRSQIDRRAKRFPTPRQYVADDHFHRRSFAEIAIDRKFRAQPFDGKSFHGLREALARRFQSGWRP